MEDTIDDLMRRAQVPLVPTGGNIDDWVRRAQAPLIPSDEDVSRHSIERQQLAAREADADRGDTYLQRFGHQLAGRLPIVASIHSAVTGQTYSTARRRVQEGAPEPGDFDTVAQYERRQGEQQERESTFPGQVGQLALKLPGMAAEFMMGGAAIKAIAPKVISGAANLLSKGAVSSPGAFGLAAAKTGVQTAVIPSMWVDHAVQNNLNAGREATDIQGVPAAFALGYLNTAVLGSLGSKGNQITGAGILPVAKRLLARTGIGMGEQAGVDLAASMIAHVIPIAKEMDTGFGLTGDLFKTLKKGFKGEGWDWSHVGTHAFLQAMTFAAFAGIHEAREGPPQAPSKILDAFGKAAKEMIDVEKASPQEAEAALNDVWKQFDKAKDARSGNISRERAARIFEDMPEGPARDFAMVLVESLPARPEGPPRATPETMEVQRRGEAVQPEPAAPTDVPRGTPEAVPQQAPGIRPAEPGAQRPPFMRPPGAPETRPAGPGSPAVAPTPPVTPTQPTAFKTSKGSTYVVHEDGTTTRTKSDHADVGHDAGDKGAKERSSKTVYVPNSMGAALSGAGVEGLSRTPLLVIKDGKASLLTWNAKEGKWGRSPLAKDVPITDKPAVGLQPLELWNKIADVIPGYETYKKQHAGNSITEMVTPTGQPEAATLAPKARMTAQERLEAMRKKSGVKVDVKPEDVVNVDREMMEGAQRIVDLKKRLGAEPKEDLSPDEMSALEMGLFQKMSLRDIVREGVAANSTSVSNLQKAALAKFGINKTLGEVKKELGGSRPEAAVDETRSGAKGRDEGTKATDLGESQVEGKKGGASARYTDVERFNNVVGTFQSVADNPSVTSVNGLATKLARLETSLKSRGKSLDVFLATHPEMLPFKDKIRDFIKTAKEHEHDLVRDAANFGKSPEALRREVNAELRKWAKTVADNAGREGTQVPAEAVKPASDPAKPESASKPASSKLNASQQRELDAHKEAMERWEAQAKEDGLDVKAVRDYAAQNMANDAPLKDLTGQLIREVLAKHPEWRTLKMRHDKRPTDAASVRGLDDAANALTGDYDVLFSKDRPRVDTLFDILVSGKPPRVGVDAAYREAMERVAAERDRPKGEDEGTDPGDFLFGANKPEPAKPSPKEESAGWKLADKWEKESVKDLKKLFGEETLFSFQATPEAIFQLAKYTAAKIIKGVYSFAEFSKGIIGRFGDDVKPHVQKIWDMANEHIKEAVKDNPEIVGINREHTDAARSERGDAEYVPPNTAEKTHPAIWEQAKAAMAENPRRGELLVKELIEKPRAIEDADVDAAVLLHRNVELSNLFDSTNAQLTRARQKGDIPEIAKLEREREDVIQALRDTEKAASLSGTDRGRALAAYKMLADRKFNLARMLAEREKVEPGGMTDAIKEEVIVDRQKILDAKKKATESEETDKSKRIQTEILEPQKTERTKRADKEFASAWKEFVALAGNLNSAGPLGLPLDPKVLIAGIKLAKAAIKKAIASVADFIETVGQQRGKPVGAELRPVLTEAWEKAHAEIEREKANLVAGADPKDAADIAKLAQKLAKQAIDNGIHEEAEITADVHAKIKQILPDFTLRDAQDAILNDGEWKALNQDATEKRFRQIRAIIRLKNRLEDVKNRIHSSKVGSEREKLDLEASRLKTELDEALKKAPFPEEPGKIKSPLDGRKTSLLNQIEDISDQIAAGIKKSKALGKIEPDDATKHLISIRDALKADHEKIFERPGLTDAQRIELAIKSAERTEAEYKRMLAENDVAVKEGGKKLSEPRLDAIRSRNAALLEEIKALRDAGSPKRTPEEIRDQARGTWLTNQAAKVAERIATGNFEPEAKKERGPLSPGTLAAKFAYDKIVKEYDAKHEARRVAMMTKGQRALYETGKGVNVARSIFLGGDLTPILRQGLFVAVRAITNPSLVIKSMKEAYKAFKSKEGAFKSAKEIEQMENFKNGRFKRGEIHFIEDGAHDAASEGYMGGLKAFGFDIPWFSGLQRANVAFINRLRADYANFLYANLAKGGKVTDAEGRIIGNHVNVSTGRGALGPLEASAEWLTQVFLAPRYVVSRFQLLTGQPIWKNLRSDSAPRARKLIALEYAKVISAVAMIITMIKLAGGKDVDIELDGRSGRVGKLKVGNTLLDPTAGLASVYTLLTRIRTQETKTASGEIRPLSDVKWGQDDLWDTITGFGRGKLAPVPGAAISALTKKNVAGERVTPGGEAIRLVQPLVARDIYEAFEDLGVPRGTAVSLWAMFGGGTQTQRPR